MAAQQQISPIMNRVKFLPGKFFTQKVFFSVQGEELLGRCALGTGSRLFLDTIAHALVMKL